MTINSPRTPKINKYTYKSKSYKLKMTKMLARHLSVRIYRYILSLALSFSSQIRSPTHAAFNTVWTLYVVGRRHLWIETRSSPVNWRSSYRRAWGKSEGRERHRSSIQTSHLPKDCWDIITVKGYSYELKSNKCLNIWRKSNMWVINRKRAQQQHQHHHHHQKQQFVKAS